MCGICGILTKDSQPVSPVDLQNMTDVMAHRGPLNDGFFREEEIGLGHRRLAIIDLSPAGNQPRMSYDGRYVITFNGEIYNFRELRVELEALGHPFHSRTDTEVLVNAYLEWGPEAFLKLDGIFGLAIWDRREHELIVARDRYGVKPIYYYSTPKLFAFASEVKALLKHPVIGVGVNLQALTEYFTFQNIFSDLTLFDGVKVLPAGNYVKVAAHKEPQFTQYWDFDFNSEGFDLSYEETQEQLEYLFRQAVKRQLVSDVPLGSYLSGGMDSGSITAVAAQNFDRLRTFTCGFDLSSASGLELGYDERHASEVMANLFKTEHYEVVLHAGDMEYILPKLIWHLEDLRVGQCYPNYYAAQLASKFVTVVLSGTGGDELFAGYPWRYYRGLRGGKGNYVSAYYDYWQRLVPDGDRKKFFAPSVFTAVKDYQPEDQFRAVIAERSQHIENVEQAVNTSLYFEIKTFLHGLLIVEDKLSMAHSLETRVPFLDNDLVDFAMRIPPSFKLRDLETAPYVDEDEAGKRRKYQLQARADGKLVLRDAMSKLIPENTTERAKQGFSAPDASWFRGESIDYVNELLRNPRAEINEFLQPTYVKTVLKEHSSGQQNHRLLIWSLLSFEWWLRTFL